MSHAPMVSQADLAEAAVVVDSDPVIRTFAALEWSELDENGRVWIAAIVREAGTRGRPLRSDTIVEVNAFLAHMAERYRQQTSRRVLGIRRYSLSRMHAMQLALATFDEALEEVPFGHPDHAWDRGHAHELVDEELRCWEA